MLMQQQPNGAGDDLMDAKPSLLALTPVVRCTPVPMQLITEKPASTKLHHGVTQSQHIMCAAH